MTLIRRTPPSRHRIQGVEDKIEEHLLQLLPIAVDGRDVFLHLTLDFHLGQLDLIAGEPKGFFDDALDAVRFQFDLAFSSEVQEVAYDLLGSLGFGSRDR